DPYPVWHMEVRNGLGRALIIAQPEEPAEKGHAQDTLGDLRFSPLIVYRRSRRALGLHSHLHRLIGRFFKAIWIEPSRDRVDGEIESRGQVRARRLDAIEAVRDIEIEHRLQRPAPP